MDSVTAMDRDPNDKSRRQRTKSWLIAIGLALLVVIFYAATIVRFGFRI